MILFKEDWDKYPTAIPDFTTTNTSFLDYCEKLRLMGVENCLFPLALMNPELQGVDPYDPSLTPEVRTLIFNECRFNIWYYLREVHRVAPMASAEGIPLRAHRGNIAYAWACMCHLSVALTIPRQLGKSVIADAVNQWAMNTACRNTRLILVTKDDSLRLANVDRMKKSRKLLPLYISNQSRRDPDNTFEIANTFLENRFSTVIGQPTLDGANKAARGLTSPIFQFDEPPFTKNIKIMVSAALPAFIAASAEAEKFGFPYYIGYTTTAGKMNDTDGAFMYKIFHEGMPWTEFLYDCKNQEKLLARIRRSCTGDDDLVYINFLHYQLGYSDEWLYRAMAKTHSHGQEADRDYFNIWTNGTAEHPLSKVILDAIIGSRRDIAWLELFEREYAINWYISEDKLAEYVQQDRKMLAGIDTSEGIGKDYISMTIISEDSLETLGTFSINETNILNYIDWICDVMVKYPNLIIIPENKSTGVALIDALLIKLPALGIDPLKRIYNRLVDDNLLVEEKYEIARSPLSKRPLSFYTSIKTMFGFRTSGSGKHARNQLYVETLQTAGRYGGHAVRDNSLAGELLSLSVKDGRIDHSNGMHDDRVISWLLPIWMLSKSKNLTFYGITKALSTAKDVVKAAEKTEPATTYDLYKERQEQIVRSQINVTLNKIKETNDPLIVDNLTRTVKALEKQIVNVDKLPKSINELIADAMQMRQTRINHARLGESLQRKPKSYFVGN